MAGRRQATTVNDYDVLRRELAAFARRLDAREREFREQGAFSDTYEVLNEEIRKRQAAIKGNFESALQKGATWDLLKYEFERDFNALSEEFARWEKRLDTETIKRTA